MNHIYAKFRDLFFVQTKGYLMVDEMSVDWDVAKVLPLKVMRKDYIVKRKEDGRPVDYKEYWIVNHKYNNEFNIFEAIIRNAIIAEKIAISDTQLDRICSPVLSDNNKSVLHHLSYRRFNNLQTLFLKTNISDYINTAEKHFYFFMDFDGKSPLDFAID